MTLVANPITPTTRLDGVAHASLALRRDAARITISAAAGLARLYDARFEGPAPSVVERGQTIEIEYPLISPATWIHPRRRSAAITLAAELPWDIRFGGGVHRLRADLTAGALGSFEIAGGVSDAELRLPAPDGIVPLRIHGGARRLTVVRPHAIPIRLRVGGGASRLALDDQRYGAIGGETRLDTPHAADAEDRYDIEITGGASRLTIATMSRSQLARS
jgi:hypothetical protein